MFAYVCIWGDTGREEEREERGRGNGKCGMWKWQMGTVDFEVLSLKLAGFLSCSLKAELLLL
jgi:hypothetical protein